MCTLAVHIDVSLVAAKGTPSFQRSTSQAPVCCRLPYYVHALVAYAHHNSPITTQINFLYLFTAFETRTPT